MIAQFCGAHSTELSHISLAFRAYYYFSVFDGSGFYSEQAYTFDLWRPYRQGVHHVRQAADRLRVIKLSSPQGFPSLSSRCKVMSPVFLQELERSELIARQGLRDGIFFPEPVVTFRGQLEGRLPVPVSAQ